MLLGLACMNGETEQFESRLGTVDFRQQFGQLAEDRPTLLFADPQLFAPALAYNERDLETEIGLVELTRKQMVSILRTVPDEALDRVGIHSVSGPVTLEDVLTKCTTHLDHHLRFVHEKRIALGLPG